MQSDRLEIQAAIEIHRGNDVSLTDSLAWKVQELIGQYSLQGGNNPTNARLLLRSAVRLEARRPIFTEGKLSASQPSKQTSQVASSNQTNNDLTINAIKVCSLSKELGLHSTLGTKRPSLLQLLTGLHFLLDVHP